MWKLMADLGARIEIKVPQPIHARLWVKGKDLALPPEGQLGFILEAISKSKKEYERDRCCPKSLEMAETLR
jgi:hypothetical protein